MLLNMTRSTCVEAALLLDPPLLNLVSAVAVGALIGAEPPKIKIRA